MQQSGGWVLEKLKRLQYGARIKLYSGDHLNVADIAGRRTQFLRGGTGATLLYLHTGIGETNWMPFHQALARQFDLIAPAHPGFGLSESDDEFERIEDLVFHYLDLLNHLSLDRVHIVGASLGGWIAAELALRYPERVNRLALVDAAGIEEKASPRDPLFESLSPAQLRSTLFSETDSFAGDLLFPDTEDPGRIGLVSRAVGRTPWASDLSSERLTRHLHRIQSPTLVLWGANDSCYPVSCGQRFHESISNSTLSVIEKCGHLPMFEQESRFVTAVTRFLNADEGGSGNSSA